MQFGEEYIAHNSEKVLVATAKIEHGVFFTVHSIVVKVEGLKATYKSFFFFLPLCDIS